MLKKTTTCLALVFLAFCSTAQTLIKNYGAIGDFAQLGSVVYYAADDGVHGSELWKTDGTAAGTVLVKDIRPGVNSSNVSLLTAFKGKVYFSADDGINGLEVWQSDGTTAGTNLLKDIGPGTIASQPYQFTVMNNYLYFGAAADGTYSTLWKTDGTAAGTVPVTLPGDFTSVSELTVVGNSLYFVKNPHSLYQSDGTTAGTKRITVDDFYTIQLLQNINGKLVFITTLDQTQNNTRLYQLDPATTTPQLLHTFQAIGTGSNAIGNITQVPDGFYFSIETVDGFNADDALWKSNGTSAGTISVINFPWTNFQQGGTGMKDFIFFNNRLYFAGTNDHSIWSSDGTAAGTKQADATNMQSPPVLSGPKFFFNSQDQLWSFNGREAAPEVTQINPTAIFADGGTIYFTANASGSVQLWNNKPAALLQVALGYQPLTNGATSSFAGKSDSLVTMPVTLQNTGNRELVLGGISIAGNAFYVNGRPSRTIAAGQSETFNLLYYPVKQGTEQAVLQIKSTSSGGQQEFVQQLSGTASGKTSTAAVITDPLLKSIVFPDSIPAFVLTHDTVTETAPVGTVIGNFQVKGNPGYVFSLIKGTGDDDNAAFTVMNGKLLSAATFNYSAKSTFSIRVHAVAGKDTLAKNFTVSVANAQVGLADGACAPSFQSLSYGLYDVAYNGTRIIAAGTTSTLILSDDDGLHWKKVPTGMSADFTHLRFTDPKTGYLLGTNNVLLKTLDNGDSWFPLNSPDSTYPGITGFSFPSSAVGFVLGSGGIFKTTDGGITWNKSADIPFGISLQDLSFITAGTGFSCGTQATLIKTTDGGKSWQSIPLKDVNPSVTLNHIVFPSIKTGFMTTNQGDLLKTTDGGTTWALTGHPPEPIERLYFTNEQDGYALSEFTNGSIYKTIDGGMSWTTENTGITGNNSGLAFNAGASKSCLVTRSPNQTSEHPGSAISVKTGGSWLTRAEFANYTFAGGDLFTNGTGYAMGAGNVKTTDGGLTWHALNISIPNGDAVTSASFISADTGFYTTRFSLFKTTNGGADFAAIRTDSFPIQSFYFYDSQTGFYTNGQYAYRTIDGGANWSQNPINGDAVPFSSLCFLTRQLGFATAKSNILYKTVDGGANWIPKDMGASNFLSSVYFIDDQNGFLGGANGLLMRTTDGGTTWQNVVNSFPYYYVAFRFTDKNHGYVLGKNYGATNEVFETFDAGQTWAMILQSDYDLEGFTIDDGHLFVTGASGTILQLNSAGSLPVNVGYIKGDTIVAARNQVIYSVPSIAGTNYQWAFTGNATVEYHQNNFYISWERGGKYQLTVTPVNSCGTGIAKSISVQVVDIPDPVITGPDTVMAGAAHAPYLSDPQAGETFAWSATGGNLQSQAGNTAKVNWGAAGNGTVVIVATDTALDVRKSALLNVLVQSAPPGIPDGDLEVSVTGSTCKGSNNGSIRVTAQKPMSYIAVITGPGFSKSYNFTDSLKAGPFAPGAYSACIRLASDTSVHRCYDLVLTEPKDLSVYSSINSSTGLLNLDLAGSENYHVELNGHSYSTNASFLSLPLNNGSNQLKVSTDRLCQGIVEKVIDFHLIKLYPDPFADHITIDLGGSPQNVAHVRVSNASGKLLYNSDLPNTSGSLNVSLPGFLPGAYVLSLTLGQTTSVFKIVKQ